MTAMEPQPPKSPEGSSDRFKCPTCGAATSAGSDAFPFCSARCRMVDLGRWLDGRYTVSREVSEEDLDDPTLHP